MPVLNQCLDRFLSVSSTRSLPGVNFPRPNTLASASARALWLVAGVALLLLGTGCKVFPPIGEMATSRISTDWVRPLYALPGLAYRPVEPGGSTFVISPATPPDGLLVVASKDRRFRGIEARTGEVLWELDTRGPNVAPPGVFARDLVVGSTDGTAYRVHQRNGKPVWNVELPGKGGVTEAPVIADGRVFITSIDNRLSVLKLDDGSVLWSKRRPHLGQFTITGQAGALVVRGRVVTGFSDGTLAAYAVEDGATHWTVSLAGKHDEFVDVDTTPLRSGDHIIAGSYAGGLHAIDMEGENFAWSLPGEGYGTPVLFEGTLYVPQAKGRMHAVDAETGQVMWSSAFRRATPTRPTVTRRHVLVSVGSAMLVLDRGSGRVVERVMDTYGFTAPPTFVNGTVYAQSNSGFVYALGLY